MALIVENDTAASLAATGTETTEDNKVSTDAAAESSTASGAESDSPTEGDKGRADILKRFDELEGKKPAADSPPTKDDAEDGAKSDGHAAEQDEPTAGKDKATPDASQDKEFNENFSKRAEWKAIERLAPGKEKELRAVARQIFTQEKALRSQVERLKPAGEYVERIRRTGVELENTAALIEGWQRGDEQAENILTELITDLQTRRGTVLSSPELVKESKDLDAGLADGSLEESYVTKRKAELLKLQKGEAVLKQTEAERQAAQKAQSEQRINQLVQDRTTAIAAWESKAAKDPDFAEISDLVLAKARVLMDDRQAAAKSLLPATEMTAVLDEALAAVKASLTKLLPGRKVIKPVRDGGSSSTNSRRQPTNERERIMARFDELEAQ